MTLKKLKRRGARANQTPMWQLTRPKKLESAVSIVMEEGAESDDPLTDLLTCFVSRSLPS
jgi:hypothetical protein